MLSPFPSHPWKLDWQTNPARQQALVASSPLEHVFDHYRWNDNAFSVARHLGDKEVPGVDYLFLYWIARQMGLISAQD